MEDDFAVVGDLGGEMVPLGWMHSVRTGAFLSQLLTAALPVPPPDSLLMPGLLGPACSSSSSSSTFATHTTHSISLAPLLRCIRSCCAYTCACCCWQPIDREADGRREPRGETADGAASRSSLLQA